MKEGTEETNGREDGNKGVEERIIRKELKRREEYKKELMEERNVGKELSAFSKKKRILNPNLQYRKAKEPTVRLHGLTEKVLTQR